MSIAWLISMCYIKYKEETIIFFKDNKLNKFTYNKALTKIIESLQVSKEDKLIIKSMIVTILYFLS